jgi:hypothetical protein
LVRCCHGGRQASTPGDGGLAAPATKHQRGSGIWIRAHTRNVKKEALPYFSSTLFFTRQLILE